MKIVTYFTAHWVKLLDKGRIEKGKRCWWWQFSGSYSANGIYSSTCLFKGCLSQKGRILGQQWWLVVFYKDAYQKKWEMDEKR